MYLQRAAMLSVIDIPTVKRDPSARLLWWVKYPLASDIFCAVLSATSSKTSKSEFCDDELK